MEKAFTAAEAYGIQDICASSAAEFKTALFGAISLNQPVVLDVPVFNNPVTSAGHWNILDIYSSGKYCSHVGTE